MARLILFLCVALAMASRADAADCDQILRMHGFLSRAQFQCNFRSYSEALLTQAHDCIQQMGEARFKEQVMAGMKLFE